MADFKVARNSLTAFARMVGHPLAGWQAESLTLRKRTTVIVAPRQSGKSRSLSLLALWRAFRKPGLQVLIVSAGDDAAKRLLAEIRHIATGSEILRGSVIDDYAGLLTLSNGSAIRSVPASEKAIRGWSIDLLLVDEAALVSDELLTSAAFPTTAARPDARIVLASSATVASGAFYDHAQAGLNGSLHVETHSWALADATWISPSVIEAARESMTPVRFAAEYLGEFASGADALFPRHLLDRATANYVMPGLGGLDGLSVLGGVDWGATRDRSALVAIGRMAEPSGLFAIAAAHAWRSGEPLDGPGGVIPQITALPARWEQLSLEVNGLGLPLAQALARRLGEAESPPPVEFVTTSSESKAATYASLRMLLEQGRLVLPTSATELLRELLLLRVELTERGGERIEAGVGHDDLADAAYLACGPWRDRKGVWRNRLTKAAEEIEPPVVSQFDCDTVETGAGFPLPRIPRFVRVGGERYGAITSAPNFLTEPKKFAQWQAEQKFKRSPVGRWYAEIGRPQGGGRV